MENIITIIHVFQIIDLKKDTSNCECVSSIKEQEAYSENPYGTAVILAIMWMELESSALGNIVYSYLTNKSLP